MLRDFVMITYLLLLDEANSAIGLKVPIYACEEMTVCVTGWLV
jgi:hypothetical protein